MIGRRVQPNADGWITGMLSPGDYFKATNPAAEGRPAGHWHGRTPNGHMCNLGAHEVVEHADGTITVTPSIKVSRGGHGSGQPEEELWHGHLKAGVWIPCQ